MNALLQPNDWVGLESLKADAAACSSTDGALADLTSLATLICGAPIAVVRLASENRQWFRSRFSTEVAAVERGLAFCAHLNVGMQPEVVADLALEPRFATNPLVNAEGGIRFYAGFPLLGRNGEILGSLAVVDHEPRRLNEQQLEALRILSRRIASHPGIGNAPVRKEADDGQRKLDAQSSHTQKMEAIGRLAGGIAHDFNNLLQVIKGCTSLAMDENCSAADLRSSLEHVQEAVDRASQLTRQLVLFGRGEVTQRVDLDLNALCGEVLPMLRRNLGDDIRVEFRAAGQIRTVNADRSQLEQILLNLCTNARDAMEGGGQLTIELENATVNAVNRQAHPWVTPGPHVLLSVRDTGSGMSEETQSRMFEPFFTTKVQRQGAGLGLSVVYGIVRQHEGFLEVESSPGEGAVFRVFLPSVNRQIAQPAQGDLAVTVVGGETILLVEDEPAVRKAAQTLLERSGYRVLTAADGVEALEIFHANHGEINLLLTDVVMPRMGGFEVAEKILEIKAVPVLFCSGYAAGALQGDRRIPAGAKILKKPYASSVLRSEVRNLLNSTKAAEKSCA